MAPQLERIVTNQISPKPILPILPYLRDLKFLYNALTQIISANVSDLESAKEELEALSLLEKIHVYSAVRKTAAQLQEKGVNGDAWYHFDLSRFFLKEFMFLDGDELAEQMDIQEGNSYPQQNHQIFGLYDRVSLKATYVITPKSIIKISKA